MNRLCVITAFLWQEAGKFAWCLSIVLAIGMYLASGFIVPMIIGCVLMCYGVSREGVELSFAFTMPMTICLLVAIPMYLETRNH